jgi:hypothetical protein
MSILEEFYLEEDIVNDFIRRLRQKNELILSKKVKLWLLLHFKIILECIGNCQE